jgi:nucleoside phosphorylase
MADSPPSSRDDFEIAIICALPKEYNAVSLIFDKFWDDEGDKFGRASGDNNTYTTGRIGKHDVLLVLLSHMGKANAAGTAASIRPSYINIRLALIVGICAGVPQTPKGEEIILGDVIISKFVIQHDFGRQYPDGFVRKDTIQDNLSKPDKNIRNLLVTFETDRGQDQLHQKTACYLEQIQAKPIRKDPKRYNYPRASEDKLFKPSYRHRHQISPECICRNCNKDSDPICKKALDSNCDVLGCDENHLVPRERIKLKLEHGAKDTQEPEVHVGAIASGDVVVKSAADRDRIAKQTGAIAFEMEGAGAWEEVPCVIVKGVCDYGDSHKDKKWQDFAAATAASTAKAILELYIRTDRPQLNQGQSSGVIFNNQGPVTNQAGGDIRIGSQNITH